MDVRARLAVISMLVAGMAGCVDVAPGDEAAEGTLTREVTMDFNEETLAALDNAVDSSDILAAFSTTRFRYTHEGPDVAVEDVTVAYVDVGARDREHPASRFTESTTLSAGDTLVIDNVLLYSPVALRAGDDTLAEREGHVVDWLEISGYPMPWSAQPGSSARWSMTAEGGYEASADRLGHAGTSSDESFSCSEPTEDSPYGSCGWQETITYEDLQARDLYGSVTASVQADLGISHDTRQAWDIDLSAAVVVDAGAQVDQQTTYEDGTGESWSGPVSATVDASADLEGLLELLLDGLEVRTMVTSGSYNLAADVEIVDPDHPEGYDPTFGMGRLSGDFPRSSESAPDDAPVGEIADVMADLWGMDLLPGDRFLVKADWGDDDLRMTIEQELVITEGGTRQVGERAVDTLRLDANSLIRIRGQGLDQSMEVAGTQVWLAKDGYLPVHASGNVRQAWDETDLEAALANANDFLPDDGEWTLPSTASLTAFASSTVDLTEYEGTVHVAPMVTVLSLTGPAMAAPLATSMMPGPYDDDAFGY